MSLLTALMLEQRNTSLYRTIAESNFNKSIVRLYLKHSLPFDPVLLLRGSTPSYFQVPSQVILPDPAFRATTCAYGSGDHINSRAYVVIVLFTVRQCQLTHKYNHMHCGAPKVWHFSAFHFVVYNETTEDV